MASPLAPHFLDIGLDLLIVVIALLTRIPGDPGFEFGAKESFVESAREALALFAVGSIGHAINQGVMLVLRLSDPARQPLDWPSLLVIGGDLFDTALLWSWINISTGTRHDKDLWKVLTSVICFDGILYGLYNRHILTSQNWDKLPSLILNTAVFAFAVAGCLVRYSKGNGPLSRSLCAAVFVRSALIIPAYTSLLGTPRPDAWIYYFLAPFDFVIFILLRWLLRKEPDDDRRASYWEPFARIWKYPLTATVFLSSFAFVAFFEYFLAIRQSSVAILCLALGIGSLIVWFKSPAIEDDSYFSPQDWVDFIVMVACKRPEDQLWDVKGNLGFWVAQESKEGLENRLKLLRTKAKEESIVHSSPEIKEETESLTIAIATQTAKIRDGKEAFAIDVAAMANARGGLIIVGVADHMDEEVGREIVGLSYNGKTLKYRLKQAADVLSNLLYFEKGSRRDIPCEQVNVKSHGKQCLIWIVPQTSSMVAARESRDSSVYHHYLRVGDSNCPATPHELKRSRPPSDNRDFLGNLKRQLEDARAKAAGAASGQE